MKQTIDLKWVKYAVELFFLEMLKTWMEFICLNTNLLVCFLFVLVFVCLFVSNKRLNWSGPMCGIPRIPMEILQMIKNFGPNKIWY